MTDQEIRAKALEISVLIHGAHPKKVAIRSGQEVSNPVPPKLEVYLQLAREIESRIREGL